MIGSLLIKKNTIFLLAIGSIFALSSCRSAPTQIYDQSKPFVAEGCQNGSSDVSPTTRSYAALLKVLRELKWKFDDIQPQSGLIKATACLGAGRGARETCVQMNYTVDSTGKISAYHSPSTPVIRKMGGHVLRWMRNIEHRFGTYRCMSQSMVVAELSIHGIE